MVPPRAPVRRGFTIIELIVTISIIAVLVTLSAAAIQKFISAGRAKATRATLQRLDAMVRKQFTTITDDARRQAVPDPVLALAGGDASRARVIWIKLRHKQRYPVTFAEVFNPAGGYVPTVPAYVEYMRKLGITAGNAALWVPQPDPAKPAQSLLGAQSAACLLMAMGLGRDAFGEDDFSFAGSTQTVTFAIPNQPNVQPIKVPCLMDSWENALTFCRWPVGQQNTGSSPLYPSGYAAGYTDPVDPQNLLLAQWQDLSSNQSGRAIFEQICHRLPTTRPPAGQAGVILSPVIVSSGPDELVGLNPVTLESLGGTDSDDNIYSVELK